MQHSVKASIYVSKQFGKGKEGKKLIRQYTASSFLPTTIQIFLILNNKCLLLCTASSYLPTLQIILILNNKCLLLCTDVSINYSCVSVFKQALKQINFLLTKSIVTTTRYFNVEQQLSTALKSTNFQTFCSIVMLLFSSTMYQEYTKPSLLTNGTLKHRLGTYSST